MNTPDSSPLVESRWPPALAILVVLVLLAALPRHVFLIPVWISRVAAAVVLMSMAAVALTKGHGLWLRIERDVIVLLAVLYVANTIAELTDMIGIITLHPADKNAFSLLSSSVAIWISNVLMFSMLYWQIDRGGPHARASGVIVRPDWIFAQPVSPADQPPGWRPLFLDYLFLGFNTATAFSPTDALPLTRRAKMLMMLQSAISLLTMVFVLSRAINVMPS